MMGQRVNPQVLQRAQEEEKIRGLLFRTEPTGDVGPHPEISIVDLEGKPFMSGMADRSAAARKVTRVNDTELNMPVELTGGQGFMFNNPGLVWANARKEAEAMDAFANELKRLYGEYPVMLPYRMGMGSADQSTMPGEVMLSYAQSLLGKQGKSQVNKYIKDNFVPDWAGLDDPKSIQQFRSLPGAKKVEFVNKFGNVGNTNRFGTLSTAEARAIITEPEQLDAPSLRLQNVGQMTGQGTRNANNPTYTTATTGEGIGTLKEKDVTTFDLMPDQKAKAGFAEYKRDVDRNNLTNADAYSLQLNIVGGRISDKALKNLEKAGVIGGAGIAGSASAGAPEFIDRIYNPQDYKFILNSDGSISTHRMAAEQSDNGNWYVFPTIQMMPNGELKEFVLPNGDPDNDAAMRNAIATNNMLRMKDKESALAFAEGAYKIGTPLETFNPMQRTMEDNIDSMLNPTPGANDRLSESPRGPIAGALADALFSVKDYFSEMPNVAEFAKEFLGTGLGAEIAGAQGKYAPITTSPSILGEVITGQIPEALDKISRGEASSNLTGEEMFDLGTGAIGAGFTGGGLLRASKPALKAAGEKFVDMADSASQRLGLSPQVAPSGPRGPNVNAMGFYSAVENAAMNLNRKSGSGQSFLNDIRKAPNIKDSEIKWMGLDEFLKGKKNVTSEEVQRYIRDNRVDIQEITYQDNPYGFTEDYEFEEYINELDPQIDGYEIENAKYFYNEFLKGGLPQYDDYITEGGDNLREIVFTLPDDATPEVYQTSHYPRVNNVLAHMRTADHKSDDGKKVLLLDEIQSDWHQAGRGTPDDKGKYTDPQYITDFEGMRAAEKEYQDLREEIIYAEEEFVSDWDKKHPRPTEDDFKKRKDGLAKLLNPLNEKLLELKNKLNSYGTVPDAPFKDEWYSVALKRAAKIASDEGYDRIALTTARTQADRYGYRKRAKTIEFDEDLGVVVSDAIDGNGHSIDDDYIQLNHPAFGNKTLEDIYGKKLANRIRNAPEVEIEIDDFVNSAPTTEKIRILKNEDGSDIEYGYDGFKHYYDKAYVDSMKKIAKKFKSKVYKGKLANGDEVTYMDITPEMKAGTKAGQPLFSAAPVAPVGGGLLSTEKENRQPSKQFGLLGV
ncbi:MAG: hypothetical protein ACO23H_12345 [Alphaproteobacteria bacterium]